MNMRTNFGKEFDLVQFVGSLVELKARGSNKEYKRRLKLIKEVFIDLAKIQLEIARELLPDLVEFEKEIEDYVEEGLQQEGW